MCLGVPCDVLWWCSDVLCGLLWWGSGVLRAWCVVVVFKCAMRGGVVVFRCVMWVFNCAMWGVVVCLGYHVVSCVGS